MRPNHPSIKKHNLASFFFRYQVVKIATLLIGHILGTIIFTILIFLLAEYLIGGFSSVIGVFFGYLWNHLKLNLLPPLIIGLSFVVIVIPNPIYALVSLILIFFNTALFLIGIQVEFLALIYIIIYIGAIAILFLFVIMMFNLKELQDSAIWSQNKDFLFISFTFYLLLFSKLYYIFLSLLLNYVDYDIYSNNVLILKYGLVFKYTQGWYNNFLHDINRALISETNDLNLNGINVTSTSDRLNSNSFDTIYAWYMNKTDSVSHLNFETYLNCNNGIHQKLVNPANTFLTTYNSPIDISIIGQVLYTYYSYLFLLATIILLVAMIGAIILALSTSEENEASKD
jgi:NADH:ubiquinone oxidoreductase subunit 6 (subunit J)